MPLETAEESPTTPRYELRTGNWMVAAGALEAGCSFFAGYPITPSSEVYAVMMRELAGRGGVAVGTPDEITALSYAVGASIAGARSMTATSGPGWALMIETVQYAIMTETPVVIVVVSRLGPATGGATQGAQGDVLLVEHATSGGYPIPVLAPVDAADCYTLTAEAFRRAELLRCPVVVLSDKEVGTTVTNVDLASLPPAALGPRATVPADAAEYVPYGIESVADVPGFSPVGGRHKVTVTGSAHNEAGQLRKNDPETLRQLRHLTAKITARGAELELVRETRREGADALLLSFGISARACRQAARDLADAGSPVHQLEVLSLFPLPERALQRALEGVRRVVIVEENGPGLYASQVRPLLSGVEVRQVNSVGRMISPEAVREAVSS